MFPGTMLRWLFAGQTFYKLGDLAPIEPQSMFLTTYIDDNFGLPSYCCFLHPAAADGTLPFLLLGGSFLRAEDAVKERLRLFEVARLEQKLELS